MSGQSCHNVYSIARKCRSFCKDTCYSIEHIIGDGCWQRQVLAVLDNIVCSLSIRIYREQIFESKSEQFIDRVKQKQ